MCPDSVEQNPRLFDAYKEWDKLTDEERRELIPFLLESIKGWRAWSGIDAARLSWLEDQFTEAGIPFRGGMDCEFTPAALCGKQGTMTSPQNHPSSFRRSAGS
jgi:hypothetical protein